MNGAKGKSATKKKSPTKVGLYSKRNRVPVFILEKPPRILYLFGRAYFTT